MKTKQKIFNSNICDSVHGSEMSRIMERQKRGSNCYQEMGMDWAHTEKTSGKHHKASASMEPTRQKEQRKAKMHKEMDAARL